MTTDWEPRKQPGQARSKATVRHILDASLRILSEEGALGFTTTKVAAEAGISVGSLYQYFPNKQALIVALHDEDIDQGWVTANEILDNPGWSARRKIVEVTRWFFESEADEAATLGVATGSIGLFLSGASGRSRDAELMEAATARAATFIADSSTTHRTKAELRFAANYLVTTIEALAKATAGRDLSRRTRRRWADHTANLLADNLDLPDELTP